ncbi:hypothetical protein ABEY43_06760 [Priestia megaterium]
MKKYYVEVPVVMKMMIGVEAKNEQEAIEKVFSENVTIDVKDENDKFEFIDYEWEMHKKVVEGNFYHGNISELYIEEEE